MSCLFYSEITAGSYYVDPALAAENINVTAAFMGTARVQPAAV